jgi:hypothetical protein
MRCQLEVDVVVKMRMNVYMYECSMSRCEEEKNARRDKD